MVPKAVIAHHTEQRLRLKFTMHRGDKPFFDALAKKLGAAFKSCALEANASTGSILMIGKPPTPQAVAEYGRREELFVLDANKPRPMSLATFVASHLQSADRRIQQVTSGHIDLPGATFMALLIYGSIELIRGNWRTPPWYTAFWYAFGLYSKSLIDQVTAEKLLDPPGTTIDI